VEQSSNFLESQNGSKANDNITFQDTLTHGTLDNIYVKYEELLNRSAQKHDAGSGSPSDTNYFVKKQRDLNKKEQSFFELQRNGSRVIYTNGNLE
jgi:hypothetical protein